MAGQAQSRAELQQQAAPPWGELLSFQYFQRLCPPGAGYGYSGGSMQGMRESEFRRLGGMTYLDHAGTALFPQSLLKEFTDDLSKNIYGNPHSQNISSKLTYDTIEHVRYRVSYQNDVELMIRKLAEIDLSAKLSKKREHAQTDVTPTSS